MFGRRLRSHLDHVRPEIDRTTRLNQERQKQGHDRRARIREFQVNDLVNAKKYGPGAAWSPGKITAVHGSMLFEVKLDDGRIVRKHVDQLRSRVNCTFNTNTGDGDDDFDFPVSGNATVQEATTDVDSGDNSASHDNNRPPENESAGEQNNSNATNEQSESENIPESAEPENTLPRRSGRIRHPPVRFEPGQTV